MKKHTLLVFVASMGLMFGPSVLGQRAQTTPSVPRGRGKQSTSSAKATQGKSTPSPAPSEKHASVRNAPAQHQAGRSGDSTPSHSGARVGVGVGDNVTTGKATDLEKGVPLRPPPPAPAAVPPSAAALPSTATRVPAATPPATGKAGDLRYSWGFEQCFDEAEKAVMKCFDEARERVLRCYDNCKKDYYKHVDCAGGCYSSLVQDISVCQETYVNRCYQCAKQEEAELKNAAEQKH